MTEMDRNWSSSKIEVERQQTEWTSHRFFPFSSGSNQSLAAVASENLIGCSWPSPALHLNHVIPAGTTDGLSKPPFRASPIHARQ